MSVLTAPLRLARGPPHSGTGPEAGGHLRPRARDLQRPLAQQETGRPRVGRAAGLSPAGDPHSLRLRPAGTLPTHQFPGRRRGPDLRLTAEGPGGMGEASSFSGSYRHNRLHFFPFGRPLEASVARSGSEAKWKDDFWGKGEEGCFFCCCCPHPQCCDRWLRPDPRRTPAFAELKCFLKSRRLLGKDLESLTNLCRCLDLHSGASPPCTRVYLFPLRSDKRFLRSF